MIKRGPEISVIVFEICVIKRAFTSFSELSIFAVDKKTSTNYHCVMKTMEISELVEWVLKAEQNPDVVECKTPEEFMQAILNATSKNVIPAKAGIHKLST